MIIKDEKEWEQANSWFVFADEIIAFVHKKTKHAVFGDDPIKQCIDSLFRKAFKHYKAIVCLCKEGYGQDALLLSRVLLEIYFYMKYLRNPSRKIKQKERAVQYIVSELYDKKKLAEYIRKYDENYDVPDGFFDELNKELKILGEPEQWPRQVLSIAEEIGEESEYRKQYSYLSLFVHSKAMSFAWYQENTIGGKVYFDINESDFGVLEAIHRGTVSFNRILEQWRCEFRGIKTWELDKIVEKSGLGNYL